MVGSVSRRLDCHGPLASSRVTVEPVFVIRIRNITSAAPTRLRSDMKVQICWASGELIHYI